ncbi:MAG TPA: hypothetical protein VKK79_20710 [Candidatus Lokiarchaeia archaeon]|nr:hypothetical protein [Candidatus Lokiarchaeia archaeon]
MEFSTWTYRNEESLIYLERVPNYYERELEEGDQRQGRVTFVCARKVDEIFGPESRFSVSWESKPPLEYHHGKAVRDSIKQWSAIEVNVERRESAWINRHECEIWYGRRTKMQQKRVYQTGIIHALFYCDTSQRFFEVHGETTFQFRDNYNNLITSAFNSIQCHPGQY